MKKLLFILVTLCVSSLTIAQTTTENYIKTTSYQIKTPTGTVSNADKIESITYFDDLGRPKQSVGIRAGGNSEDIITHIGYDDFGRQAKEYLSYTSTTGIASYRTDASGATNSHYDATKYEADFPSVLVGNINAFSKKEFEASPLNRVFINTMLISAYLQVQTLSYIFFYFHR